MQEKSSQQTANKWQVEKIGVIGPGIVGMPMAAMLSNSGIKSGSDDPAKVIVVQRDSASSGWKVDAINNGRSVIGGIEPELDAIIKESVRKGLLSATYDYMELADADVILVSVQTDKKGFEPDYGPLFGALDKLGDALRKKPAGKIPLIIFESTLAPTTMDTLIREHFRKYGMEEGRDIFLGNSPNRVMPGRLVERIRTSDKLAGGLHPDTPGRISELYANIIKEGKLYETNSLTAEIVKTLENAYRDVRIAFSTEIVRYCDDYNIDFYAVRASVNKMLSQTDEASKNPNAVPSGGLLIPMLGVGGHCLPKDGILLWWRKIEKGYDTSNSLILTSRLINDESPSYTFKQAEGVMGEIKGRKVALLGVAYRFNSEDTRNSPTTALADLLQSQGIDYIMHDPYVRKNDQNLLKFNMSSKFTNDLGEVLKGADIVFMCTAHRDYIESIDNIQSNGGISGLMDGCNIYKAHQFKNTSIRYAGIGRGEEEPDNEFVKFVYSSFRSMETGIANELLGLIDFYNSNYAFDEFNKVNFKDVQRLAKTCSTGCEIAEPGKIEALPEYKGFSSRLARCAYEACKGPKLGSISCNED